jgi:hypothetical protein
LCGFRGAGQQEEQKVASISHAPKLARFNNRDKVIGMPSSEFMRLVSECERLTASLKTCTDPTKRKELLKQMKMTLDDANRAAEEPPAK